MSVLFLFVFLLWICGCRSGGLYFTVEISEREGQHELNSRAFAWPDTTRLLV